MKRSLRVSLIVLLAIGALLAVVIGTLLLQFLPPDAVLTIDDETMRLHALSGPLEWAAVIAALLIAGLVVAIVVPLALVVGLGVPALLALLALGLGLLLAAGLLALALSPLLLLVLAGLWLWRRSARRGGGATMAG